jgi:hypothetical protein
MEEKFMPVAVKIPPVLREALGYEAESALVDVLNQIQADQRNGFERSIEMHLQAFRDYLDRRLTETEAKADKRFNEADFKNEKRFNEADLKNEKRFNEADLKNEKRFAELQVAFETQMAQNHSSLLRWMFAFFIGMIFSLASLLFVYFQLLVKVKP